MLRYVGYPRVVRFRRPPLRYRRVVKREEDRVEFKSWLPGVFQNSVADNPFRDRRLNVYRPNLVLAGVSRQLATE